MTGAGEFEFIDWIRRQLPESTSVLLGPGDDAAILKSEGKEPWLVTTDMLMDGTCFRLKEAGARRVGRKAMAVNLSDIAAMAGQPTAALVSVALPVQGARVLGEELFLGIRELADQFQVAIAGGDTNTWKGPLVICVALLGKATSRGPVRRSGARPGDWLLVTGPVGGSIFGKHLDFTPRINEALLLHSVVDLHAMIDISDGLSADIGHLCTESGCGAMLDAETIPISQDAYRFADGKPALEHALEDGEDFELAFAVSPEDGTKLVDRQPLGKNKLVKIGECVDQGLWLKSKGQQSQLEPKGYRHEMK